MYKINKLTEKRFFTCYTVVDSAISMMMTKEGETSSMKQFLGKDLYIKEYRTIILQLPRQCGKSTYIAEHASIDDLVIYNNRLMMKNSPNTLATRVAYNSITSFADDIFQKSYETIWCDELSLTTLSGRGFNELIKYLTKTGNEMIVGLTTLF